MRPEFDGQLHKGYVSNSKRSRWSRRVRVCPRIRNSIVIAE